MLGEFSDCEGRGSSKSYISMVASLLIVSGCQALKRKATFSSEGMDFLKAISWPCCMNASTVEDFEFIFILKALHPFQVISDV